MHKIRDKDLSFSSHLPSGRRTPTSLIVHIFHSKFLSFLKDTMSSRDRIHGLAHCCCYQTFDQSNSQCEVGERNIISTCQLSLGHHLFCLRTEPYTPQLYLPFPPLLLWDPFFLSEHTCTLTLHLSVWSCSVCGGAACSVAEKVLEKLTE